MSRSRELSFDNAAIYLHHISANLSTGDSVCPFPFSLAASKGITFCFLFLPVLRCFNSRRNFASRHPIAGKFSNSEILGSKPACGSPRLIAACHVLLKNLNQAIPLLVYYSKIKLSSYIHFHYSLVLVVLEFMGNLSFLLASLSIILSMISQINGSPFL